MASKKTEDKIIEDLVDVGLNEEGGQALEYLQSEDCLVPFFKGLSEANVFRIGVAYAIKEKGLTPASSEEIGKTGSTGKNSSGKSWTGFSGGINGLNGVPNVYRLLEIVSKDGIVVNPNRLLEGYAHVGLLSLAERIKKGESLNKIFN